MALGRDLLAGVERTLDEFAREPLEARVVEIGEQRDPAYQTRGRTCHVARDPADSLSLGFALANPRRDNP